MIIYTVGVSNVDAINQAMEGLWWYTKSVAVNTYATTINNGIVNAKVYQIEITEVRD